MPAALRHFAINADDVARAKRFYEGVFGWSFRPWGPPDYYQITMPESASSVRFRLGESSNPAYAWRLMRPPWA